MFLIVLLLMHADVDRGDIEDDYDEIMMTLVMMIFKLVQSKYWTNVSTTSS
jgi:hypothetical protein